MDTEYDHLHYGITTIDSYGDPLIYVFIIIIYLRFNSSKIYYSKVLFPFFFKNDQKL